MWSHTCVSVHAFVFYSLSSIEDSAATKTMVSRETPKTVTKRRSLLPKVSEILSIHACITLIDLAND